MISEFDRPFELETPAGTLLFNQPLDTGSQRRFQLVPGDCSASLPVRTTEDDVPQGDGKIPHRRWRSGYGAHLVIDIWQDYDPDSREGEPACDAVLVDMLDLLSLHVNEMIRTGLVPGAPNARLIWTPADGYPERMLDRCQLVSAGPPEAVGGALSGTRVPLDIDSAYPYYLAHTETDTDIHDGSSAGSILNAGNADQYPVWKVYGPFTDFVLTNTSVVDLDGNPLQLVYGDDLPGAVSVADGHYIEFDFFRGTAYLDGNQGTRQAGIHWLESDLFPLVHGENVITALFGGGGANTKARCLSNSAWA